MKILLKNISILDSASSFYKLQKDILIENNRYVAIEDEIHVDDSTKIITSEALHISQSWVDLKADFCDPGNEQAENLQSGIRCAEMGGFGHVFLVPSTHPPTDNKAQVTYLQSLNNKTKVQIHPIGSITKKLAGESLAEMYDMYQAGTHFFSDDLQLLATPVLYRALLYAKNFNGIIISFPQEPSFSLHGQINEGKSSVQTGLKAIPSIGEEIRVQRDINLAEYANTSIHLTGISSKKSVDLIRKAKAKGIAVTCDIHVHHLLFNESNVVDFNTSHKVFPPYRREEDRLALWEGIKDDTIDCIVSDHRPKVIEEKDVTFDNAAFGSISLPTFFAALNTKYPNDLAVIINKISILPRKIANFSNNTSIEIGNCVDCTLFDPQRAWIFNNSTNPSKSSNSPLLGKTLIGSVIDLLHLT